MQLRSRNFLRYICPTWTPFVPKSYTTLIDLLDAVFKSYLYYVPHPSKPVDRTLEEICECIHLFRHQKPEGPERPERPRSYEEAQEIYLREIPGMVLLFDDDIEVAALYAALLLKDFEMARRLSAVSKEKVLAFLGAKNAFEALETAVLEKNPLPKAEHGVPFDYWKHMNVFDSDHELVMQQLKSVADTTHFALSYLMKTCEISMGHTIQIGFKDL